MTPFAWLLGLVLPACGAEGPHGLPAPELMDMTRIERPATPNTFLAGPAGMKPAPDLVVAEQVLPAGPMYKKARAVFGRQPRTFVAAEFPERHQVHYVVRSVWLNFPDLVTVEADPDGAGNSTLTIWARSVYGRSDLGVNRARTEAWLAALGADMQQSNQR
jgi:hypothetical protein